GSHVNAVDGGVSGGGSYPRADYETTSAVRRRSFPSRRGPRMVQINTGMPTNPFTPLTPEHLQALSEVLPDMPLVLPGDSMEKYTRDETEDLRFAPEAVALPGSVGEVSKLLAFCHTHRIPVTPRGAGTGLSGGSLARYGGVMVSLERMSRIVAIDEANLQARVEAGVITQHLIDAAAER